MGFVIMSTTNINKRIKILEDLQEELNKLKALYEESLENDTQFQETQEAETKVRNELKEKKVKILANSTYENFRDQMKELKQDIKENKEALSQELVEYYKESGNQEIVDEEGREKIIKFTAKLVNK